MNKRILLITLESSVLSLNAFVVKSLTLVWLFVITTDCSRPGFPILHYPPEFAQTHIHWVGDAIQTSNPLSPPSPFAFNLSQHQGLYQWAVSSHQAVNVLELNQQPFNQYSELIFFRTGWFDLLAVQDCQEFSPAKSKNINSSALSLLYGPTLTSVHNY